MGQRYHLAEQEADVPPSRWENYLAWVFVGYFGLWILVSLAQIDGQIRNDILTATSIARWNAGLCLLLLAVTATNFARRPWLLRKRRNLFTVPVIYVWCIAVAYDGVAQTLMSPSLPTLEQLAPGLTRVANALFLFSGAVASAIFLWRNLRSPKQPSRLPPAA